jgi:hypothetical protein
LAVDPDGALAIVRIIRRKRQGERGMALISEQVGSAALIITVPTISRVVRGV